MCLGGRFGVLWEVFGSRFEACEGIRLRVLLVSLASLLACAGALSSSEVHLAPGGGGVLVCSKRTSSTL